MEKILLISRDPGATNQLVALHHILTGPDSERRKMLFDHLKLTTCPEIIPIAKDYAYNIWRQNDISPLQWPEMSSEPEISAYLAGFAPDQIITGTCHVDDRTEQGIWQLGRRLGIITTAFLDSSHNIALRFRNEVVILPDRVGLIDDTAVSVMHALGLPARALFISGDLYQEYIRARVSGRTRDNLCSERGDGGKLILFAADYIREMQARGVVFEITEFDCLDCLIDLLSSGDILNYLTEFTPPYHLIIRPHPKDTAGKYQDYPARSPENITIEISNNARPREAILSSHLVAGLGSALLAEARILGIPVLELGPMVTADKDRRKTV